MPKPSLFRPAAPGQLQRALDFDLWRVARPGQTAAIDPDRFVALVETLIDAGEDLTLQTLASMDERLTAAALAQHVRVFDLATVETGDDGTGTEIGGYLVKPTRLDSFQTIAGLLQTAATNHPDLFHRVMRGCRCLSNSKPEVDGLHDLLTDAEQPMFDLAVERDERLETQGYVTSEDARAFLQASRGLRFDASGPPSVNPIVRAYFRAIGWRAPAEIARARAGSAAAPEPRPLPVAHGSASRLSRLRAYLQIAHDRDLATYLTRTAELAFLVNTMAAACAIQTRPFTPQQASEAAAAVCNLGLENWPDRWGQHDSDLVTAFQVGWSVLYRDVCMRAAEHLISVAADLSTKDREVRAGLDELRFVLAREWRTGTPWRARKAFDVVLLLDQPAWAILLGLIDEFPVIHAAMRATDGSSIRVHSTGFELIADNRQVASVRQFMEQLPERLR